MKLVPNLEYVEKRKRKVVDPTGTSKRAWLWHKHELPQNCCISSMQDNYEI
jgi:hypothetical protein